MSELAELSVLLDAAVAAFSVLGGVMAFATGWVATLSVRAGDRPEVTTAILNEGVAQGFVVGVPLAMLALIIQLSQPVP